MLVQTLEKRSCKLLKIRHEFRFKQDVSWQFRLGVDGKASHGCVRHC